MHSKAMKNFDSRKVTIIGILPDLLSPFLPQARAFMISNFVCASTLEIESEVQIMEDDVARPTTLPRRKDLLKPICFSFFFFIFGKME